MGETANLPISFSFVSLTKYSLRAHIVRLAIIPYLTGGLHLWNTVLRVPSFGVRFPKVGGYGLWTFQHELAWEEQPCSPSLA